MLCVVDFTSGNAVPTVRYESEELVRYQRGSGTLIRINPCEPEVPTGHIGLKMTGLKALQQLQEIYETLWNDWICSSVQIYKFGIECANNLLDCFSFTFTFSITILQCTLKCLLYHF